MIQLLVDVIPNLAFDICRGFKAMWNAFNVVEYNGWLVKRLKETIQGCAASIRMTH